MLKPTSRLASGLNKNKTSKIISEDMAQTLIPYELFPCFQIQELFYTEDNLQSLKTRYLNKPYDIELPLGAFRFMTLHMPTRKEWEGSLHIVVKK